MCCLSNGTTTTTTKKKMCRFSENIKITFFFFFTQKRTTCWRWLTSQELVVERGVSRQFRWAEWERERESHRRLTLGFSRAAWCNDVSHLKIREAAPWRQQRRSAGHPLSLIATARDSPPDAVLYMHEQELFFFLLESNQWLFFSFATVVKRRRSLGCVCWRVERAKSL